MNPRSLLNVLKTRSGKLLVFALLFGVVMLLISHTRKKSEPDEPPVKPLETDSSTNKPQLVETIQRGMELFRPPLPKSDPKPVRLPTGTNQTSNLAARQTLEPVVALPPISLFADVPIPATEPNRVSDDYAPFGRLIPCETIITVDSSSIRTPIIGLVTKNVYHAGRLIIPAGTEVHGTAASDRSRERLASGTSWTLVWQTGEELQLNGLALDREFESDTNHIGWGITDGSAGLRGRLIKTDDLAEIKLFAATFLSGAAESLTEKQQTIFGSVDSRSLNNAPFKGAEKVLSVYAQRIYDAIQRDGFYVRVPSGKQFYIYVLQTIDRADARIGGAGSPFTRTNDGAGAAMMPTRFNQSNP